LTPVYTYQNIDYKTKSNEINIDIFEVYDGLGHCFLLKGFAGYRLYSLWIYE
jgi:hypothetical protein